MKGKGLRVGAENGTTEPLFESLRNCELSLRKGGFRALRGHS